MPFKAKTEIDKECLATPVEQSTENAVQVDLSGLFDSDVKRIGSDRSSNKRLESIREDGLARFSEKAIKPKATTSVLGLIQQGISSLSGDKSEKDYTSIFSTISRGAENALSLGPDGMHLYNLSMSLAGVKNNLPKAIENSSGEIKDILIWLSGKL